MHAMKANRNASGPCTVFSRSTASSCTSGEGLLLEPAVAPDTRNIAAEPMMPQPTSAGVGAAAQDRAGSDARGVARTVEREDQCGNIRCALYRQQKSVDGCLSDARPNTPAHASPNAIAATTVVNEQPEGEQQRLPQTNASAGQSVGESGERAEVEIFNHGCPG